MNTRSESRVFSSPFSAIWILSRGRCAERRNARFLWERKKRKKEFSPPAAAGGKNPELFLNRVGLAELLFEGLGAALAFGFAEIVPL